MSKKLFLALVVNILAFSAAFHRTFTPEQSAAIIGLATSLYLVGQAVVDAVREYVSARTPAPDPELAAFEDF